MKFNTKKGTAGLKPTAPLLFVIVMIPQFSLFVKCFSQKNKLTNAYLCDALFLSRYAILMWGRCVARMVMPQIHDWGWFAWI